MKKSVVIFATLFFAITLMGADEKYHEKMGETISQFSKCSSIEDYQTLANHFKVISNVNSDQWLPLYYEAQCYILMSFMDHNGSVSRDGYLDQAESLFTKMIKLAPSESEIYALQAFYHTGRLVINPPERAQTTAPLVSQCIGKSLGIDPNNPRAHLMKLTNEMGTAQYFGSDMTAYCIRATELLGQWDDYTPKSAIHPSWGRGQLEEIVNSCGK